MACACKGRKKQQYVWTPPEGATDSAGEPLEPITYNTEIEAKAKMIRKGGSYKPKEG